MNTKHSVWNVYCYVTNQRQTNHKNNITITACVFFLLHLIGFPFEQNKHSQNISSLHNFYWFTVVVNNPFYYMAGSASGQD